MTEIIIIASVSKNDVIGNNGNQQIFIKKDLARFKELTLNHPVIMGRVTFQAILAKTGKLLKNRTNIVISSNPEIANGYDCKVFTNLQNALEFAKQVDETIFIIGGAKIFALAIDFANKLEITRFDKDIEGDAYFPKINNTEWKIINEIEDEEDDLRFRFQTYVKTTLI